MATRRGGRQNRCADPKDDAALIAEAERLGIAVQAGMTIRTIAHLVATRRAERERRRAVLAAARAREDRDV